MLFKSFLISALLIYAAAAKAGPRLPAQALSLPLVTQQTNYSCGPAAFLSVLMYWQKFSGTEQNLYGLLKTSVQQGTSPKSFVHAAHRFGLLVKVYEGLEIADLRVLLDQKKTVILDIQAWPYAKERNIPWKDLWEDGHYVVLIGIDKNYAYFMDPSTENTYTYMPLKELPDRWHDYELVNGKHRQYLNTGIVFLGTYPVSTKLSHKKLVRLE